MASNVLPQARAGLDSDSLPAPVRSTVFIPTERDPYYRLGQQPAYNPAKKALRELEVRFEEAFNGLELARTEGVRSEYGVIAPKTARLCLMEIRARLDTMAKIVAQIKGPCFTNVRFMPCKK